MPDPLASAWGSGEDLVIVLDCETTGLSPNRTIRADRRPRIIEFYACLVDLRGETPPLAELDLLIDPGIEIPDKVQKITHITPEMVAGKPRFSAVAAQVAAFLRRAQEVIAHNASFDREVIEIELERAGVALTWPRVTCSIESSLHLKGRRLNLGDLYEHLFGERFRDAHRAKADVMALVRVVRELRRRGCL
jgi:DNA polymerase III epsilon subunit-like protein